MLPPEVEANLHKNFSEICKSLSLDKHASGEAWKSFIANYDSFLLEGDPLHWLSCALFIACRKPVAPGSSKPGVLPGNHINLGKLLRIVYLSVADFFIKIRKWADVVHLTQDFFIYLELLERAFTVSAVLYKKFKPIFFDLFSSSVSETRKVKKLKSLPPNLGRVFDFTWLLFITVKSHIGDVSDDLVSSYHLLLSCCDYIYINAILAGRDDLNRNFPALTLPNGRIACAADIPCSIDHLCDRHDGIPIEAKSMKEYAWKRVIRRLFERKILRGNLELLLDLLNPNHFEHNINYLRRTYDEYLTINGGFDETILLDVPSEPTVPLRPRSPFKFTDISVQLEAKKKFNSQPYRGSLSPPQEIKYVGDEIIGDAISDLASPNCIAALLSLVSDSTTSPSPLITNMLSESSRLERTVEKLVKKFKAEVTRSTNNCIPKALKKMELVCKLFYKLLDTIVSVECEKSAFDPMMLLKNAFVTCLFACSAEIVIFTYQVDLKFPWVLNALEIAPYHFYRIIEIIVREEELLFRATIKHLNAVEESILESLAWELKSPLWRSLITSTESIPTCEEVALHCISFQSNVDNSAELEASILDPNIKVERLSPVTSSLSESFSSPVKRIFDDSDMSSSNGEGSSTKIVAIVGARVIEPRDDDAKTANVEQFVPSDNPKERRSGSVALFFRKFYLLASSRLQDMCDQLKLTDVDIRFKIWTCFEHTIVNNTCLMLGRHLDQILMCSIYVICKISKIDKPFMELMGCYRNQPQAQSHVYRQVLISPDRSLEDLRENYDGILTSNDKEVKGDIIQFYNTIYVAKMKNILAKRFKKGVNDTERNVLSPLPVVRNVPTNSPRRISGKHSIYLRSSGQEKAPRSPDTRPLCYNFNRSPKKELQAINSMLVNATRPRHPKSPSKPKTIISQRLQELNSDRTSSSE